jgi:uncharacterized repeat protein (TIGR03847 family)
MRRLFIFDPPDRFMPATLGEPGSRTFFLQARKGRSVISVALDKSQVAVLAERLAELLTVVQDVPGEADAAEPGAAQPTAVDEARFDEPIVEAFRVGAMALSWDPDGERVVIEAQPQDDTGDYVEVDDDDEDGPDLMRVRIEPHDARAFVQRAQVLVAAGRPPCPFCGQPLEPTGHFCLGGNGQLN